MLQNSIVPPALGGTKGGIPPGSHQRHPSPGPTPGANSVLSLLASLRLASTRRPRFGYSPGGPLPVASERGPHDSLEAAAVDALNAHSSAA